MQTWGSERQFQHIGGCLVNMSKGVYTYRLTQ